jgi:hypothetical protein
MPAAGWGTASPVAHCDQSAALQVRVVTCRVVTCCYAVNDMPRACCLHSCAAGRLQTVLCCCLHCAMQPYSCCECCSCQHVHVCNTTCNPLCTRSRRACPPVGSTAAAAGGGAGGPHRPSLDSHASLTPEALLSPGLAAKYGSSTGGSSLPTSLPSGEAPHLPLPQ